MARRSILFIALVLAAMLAIVACDEETTAEPVQLVGPEDAVAMLDERVVIDVRTPAEFEEAHVRGALNIDVEAAGFDTAIEGLDKDEAYLVYCRSGRRSAIAADRMAEAGFVDIADAGGLADLAAAGAPIEA